ncbi:biotin--[acetyl-CoA-carboxylase] ligase [Methylomagnum ishizawai]|uniref:biotin--[acetyl-CoA-carboxylase] ligase n=1 Tax=Methylomagnum ishizawai TaxID=1760988 RepID=UPI001C32BE23|nr:biotin--[acetyl-CoA-carboxylase] ligase [Methylomagnum ishizawai]BBL75138.1 bifunctional ligase/repressor BirA [Methylomagnum ishizawai]
MADTIQNRLLRLLADRRFHSGAAIAAELGVSRTAVWKWVRELEALGLEVAALPGKGYRVLSPLELLDGDAIRRHLGPEATASLASLLIHDRLDSTNTQLMRLAAEGAAAGTVCLAETQTAGRGRIGREWVSPFGANIYLSLLWRYEDTSRIAGLSLAVGVGVARALAGLGVADIGLKWPNDLLLGGRKLGGILIEVAGEAHGRCAVVVGLGLNRYLPPRLGHAIDQPWADLSTDGAPPPRNRLVAALLDELLPLLGHYAAVGLEPYLPEWRGHHRWQGREAVIHQGETRTQGRIEDISAAGLLILRCEDGRLREFASGDVRLRALDHG